MSDFFENLDKVNISLRGETTEIKVPYLNKSIWIAAELLSELKHYSGEMDDIDRVATKIAVRAKKEDGNPMFKKIDRANAINRLKQLPTTVILDISSAISKIDEDSAGYDELEGNLEIAESSENSAQ